MEHIETLGLQLMKSVRSWGYFGRSILPLLKHKAHRQQRMYAWSYLTEACALIAATGVEDCDPSNTALLQRILVKASNCDVPAPDPQMDAQFDERPLKSGTQSLRAED